MPCGAAVAHQARGHVDRRILLGADGLRGRVLHGDDFGGVADFDGQVASAPGWVASSWRTTSSLPTRTTAGTMRDPPLPYRNFRSV